MENLIQRLTSEHAEIEQALAGIRPRQFRTEEGTSRLKRVRRLLHQHFRTERGELFAPLAEATRQDERLSGQLRRFSDDLAIVQELADNFVSKYEHGQPQLIEFATDHGALLTILRVRLRREEETIFPLYTRLVRN